MSIQRKGIRIHNYADDISSWMGCMGLWCVLVQKHCGEYGVNITIGVKRKFHHILREYRDIYMYMSKKTKPTDQSRRKIINFIYQYNRKEKKRRKMDFLNAPFHTHSLQQIYTML
jgi:hypothetical protein